MDLLAEGELHPAFPADAFAIVKSQTVGELTGAVQSPDYKMQRALANALYPAGDPARRTATPASASAVNLDDVKAYYQSAFRPDIATVVVVGDVTPERARVAVDRAFGAWKATGAAPSIYDPAVPRNAPSRAVIPATGRIQADVTLAQTVPVTYRDRDFPVLQLANTALSGGFGSILYHDVREVHGYAYSVESSFAGAHNRTMFSVNFGADPQNTANAERLIVDDLVALQKKPLRADRLIRAKALIIGRLPVRQESFDGVASQLLQYSLTDRPLDQDRISARAQFAASGENVRAALAKYLRPRAFARVTLAPAGP